MGMIKQVDLTKIDPLNWRYLLSLFVVIVVVLLIWSGANWASSFIKAKLPTPTEKESQEVVL